MSIPVSSLHDSNPPDIETSSAYFSQLSLADSGPPPTATPANSDATSTTPPTPPTQPTPLPAELILMITDAILDDIISDAHSDILTANFHERTINLARVCRLVRHDVSKRIAAMVPPQTTLARASIRVTIMQFLGCAECLFGHRRPLCIRCLIFNKLNNAAQLLLAELRVVTLALRIQEAEWRMGVRLRENGGEEGSGGGNVEELGDEEKGFARVGE